MADGLPVRIVAASVVVQPGVGPVPEVWLPLNGQVIAKFPPQTGIRGWLHETVSIRSPRLEDGRWHLPRNCLVRLIAAAIDRYGYVVVWRDMSKLSRCTTACLEALGADCDCSCLGAHHGQSAENWFEVVGDAVVADRSEFIRTGVVYGPRGSDQDAVIYNGELTRTKYRVERAGRRGWPAATQFMCASCMSVRASVWDHCHAHGFVRAPLCNRCNTRTWSGWDPRRGRASTTRNLDQSYFRWCPEHADPWRSCSP